MKENADKHLDKLSRKVIGKSAIESPSFDFTQVVMHQVQALQSPKATTYVPLISKRVWLVIALMFVGVMSYLIFGSSAANNKWVTALGLEHLPDVDLSYFLAQVEFSQTLIYAIMLFGIMLCVQIPILKRYFDKRLEA
ncbi:hypothetical protein [Psychroserpens sp. SPM9]|uniref:hypothetical protein n=1 Tax=Psychroserpens sp. SPM9 TaxID=2975598 RepID=UPI0021A781E9|nr:hypothetical protein [Psychroserpens sp. SPM9]MDG5492078.1 hypothetical protein [Psychroserpens sp. SPM9]